MDKIRRLTKQQQAALDAISLTCELEMDALRLDYKDDLHAFRKKQQEAGDAFFTPLRDTHRQYLAYVQGLMKKEQQAFHDFCTQSAQKLSTLKGIQKQMRVLSKVDAGTIDAGRATLQGL